MSRRCSRREALELLAGSLLAGGCSRAGPEGARVATAAPSRDELVVAFGSCNRADLPQPLWSPLIAMQPDVFAWLGDIVYARAGAVDTLPALYARVAAEPGYAALRQATRIIGVWDDNDYGQNNGGRHFVGRERAQHALLDFLDVPADDARRKRAGVYTSHAVSRGGMTVKIILLDGRYHRDDPGPASDVLGEEQWAWLEAELSGSSASVHLIGSGFQVLPDEHPYEKWSAFPRARQRLFELLTRSGAPGVVLLSGDRHLAELSRLDEPGQRRPLLELTSSGLTHSYTNVGNEPNRLRRSPLYAALNFGLVRVDPAREMITLEVRGVGGLLAFSQRVPLRALAVG
jgi:alkaline phosphatase D